MAETKVELKDVEDGLFGLSKRATELKQGFWRGAKASARYDLKQHGLQTMGPNGAWPGLSKASQERNDLITSGGSRSRRGGRKRSPLGRPREILLGNLGKITTAWKTFEDPEQLKFRQMVDWADVHNSGGVAGRGARMPSREFAYFSEKFQKRIVRRWEKFVASGWEKKKP
jgi:hypothetical protein